MKDINGTHILLKFFTTFDLSYIKIAYDLINENLIEISLHKNGCCAIQKCLEIATGIVKRSLINNIIENCLSLIIDPYGNYVVQHVIYLRDYEVNKQIIKSLLKDIIFFSKQKFSSNVVEKVTSLIIHLTSILVFRLLRRRIKGDANKYLDEQGNY